MTTLRALGLALLLAAWTAVPASAQSSGEAERKLQTIKRELNEVAAERRKLESERGDATRQLREADEQVGRSSRSLRETESRMARERATLAELRPRREAMQVKLGAQREELTRLLRAAYQQGGDAPLKALLAQDRVADANRLLTYHRYLQRDRAQRIQTLSAELAALDALEHEIAARQGAFDAARVEQKRRIGQLENDRRARATTVAQLDRRYQDRRSREQALGRDAKGLEQLLGKLRAAAARADAQRRAATAKAAREAREASRPRSRTPTRRPITVASAAPLQVGGLGWPLSGALLAGYGGRMPDGRSSEGLLIGASAGAPVKAVADGQVVYAEWMTGYGLLMIVDHGNGYMSLYAHSDALLRDAGDRVKRGEAVATVGSSGGHGRPALYFELRRNGQPVNPSSWLRQ